MWTNWFCWNSHTHTHTHRETTHCSRRSAFVCFHAQKSGMVQEIYKLGKSLRDIGNVAQVVVEGTVG